MKRIIVASGLALALMATLGSTPAAASFFQIAETCPSGLGNAFAGGAAAAEDACTVWFNPAGMTKLEDKQFVIGIHLIEPSLDYTDDGSTLFFGAPITGGEGGDAGESAIVPNLYYTQKIGSKMAWGIGINAPFGLTTEFEPGWIGRYYALKSEIVTVNINPSFAYQASPNFSIGFGLNYQTIEAELSQAVDFGSTCLALELAGTVPVGTCAAFGQVPQSNDGVAKVDADDSAFGWNVGFLWDANPNFRVGLSYRSELSYDAEGDSVISTPDPGTALFAALVGLGDSGAKAAVDLPEIISLSFWWQAATKWEVMGDVTQTGWSSLPELRIEFDNGSPDSVVTLDLDDSIKYALGATYNGGPKWALRLGFAMDETPTPSDELRTPRLPDEDRTWYTLGFDYDVTPNIGLSFAYALIDIDEARVDKLAIPGGEDFLRGNFSGEFDFGVDILSAQIRWGF
jgi:long-chain fatty acid transport protein